MLLFDYHPSWNEFLTNDIKDELNNIENQIGDDFTPNKELILRFMKMDIKKIKVIIMGQDPYFQEGAANGRSFQPALLSNFKDKFKQVSLKNIIRLIYNSYYNELLPYKEVISKNVFPINPNDWFDSLENQGVLFLNRYFTCKVGLPNSHREIWKTFSNELIKFLGSKENLTWFLWGSEANKDKDLIKGIIYSSNHPMMSGTSNPNDFFKSKCFMETKTFINWLG